jgi:hypothetical protein
MRAGRKGAKSWEEGRKWRWMPPHPGPLPHKALWRRGGNDFSVGCSIAHGELAGPLGAAWGRFGKVDGFNRE